MMEDWLNNVRDSQSDFGLDAPENLWEGIEAGLAAAGASGKETSGSGKQSRRRILPWAVVGLASACAAALALFLLLPGRGEMSSAVHDEIALVQDGVVQAGGDETVSVEDASSTSTGRFSSLIAEAPARNMAYSSAAASNEPEGLLPVVEDVVSVEDVDSQVVGTSVDAEDTAPSEKASESPRRQKYVAEDISVTDAPFDAPEEKPQRRSKKLKLGLALSNVTGNSSSSNQYAALYGSPVTRQIHSFSETSGNFPDSYGYVSVLQSNEGSEVSSSVKNYQPVQVGVTLAYSFTDRLSLESGLTYSCLISDLSSGTDKGNYRIRQSLHYLGIPLNLRYDFLKINRFSMYSSLGGQMEKCVSGKTVTDYFSLGEKISSENGKIMVEPLQWSVNAHLGAQYSFTGWAGIYLEAGAAYYFRNNSPVNCIYSERPLNFSLRAGVRFSL